MPYIRPELIVIRFDGYFDILLNDSSIPALRMNTYYLEMLENGGSEEATQYLKKKKKELEQIQENISQRSGILLSLGKLIVERQQDFFLNGPGHLYMNLSSAVQPMTNISSVSMAYFLFLIFLYRAEMIKMK